MSADSRPIEMNMTEAERLARIRKLELALREAKSEEIDPVAVIEALGKVLGAENGGTRNRVWWLVGSFGVCALIGGYLAAEVVSQGKAIVALQVEIQQCLKVKP